MRVKNDQNSARYIFLMPLLRKPAPAFKAQAWYKNDFVEIDIKSYLGKYVVLFFYPLDFTFVCPTEIIEFNDKADKFKALNCEVLAVSVDSQFSHMEYTKKPRQQGGLGDMSIPLISDINKEISQAYGCLIDTGANQGVSYRATYIIDPLGILRHISINDLSVGRNTEEYIRLVTAFKHVDENKGEVCPASWKKGEKVMIADVKNANYKELIAATEKKE